MEKQSLKPSVAKPWLQFFTKEAIESEIPQDILYNIVKNNNEGYHSNIALNYLDNRITYGEFFKKVEAAAASFEALGVKKGDTVICASITIPEMAYTLYALNKIGATMFAVDPRMTAQFLEDKVKESKAKVVLYVDVFHDKFAEMLPTLDVAKVVTISICDSMPFIKKMVVKSKLPKVQFTDKIVNWKTFLSYGKGKTSSVCKYGDNDVAAITLTGGTTGTPKGVMLTNDGFNAVMHSFYNCGVPYTRDQKFFNIIPAFSSYGIVASLHMPLSLGLEIILVPKFDPEKAGWYFKKYRPAHTLLVPAMYEKLMNSKEMKGFDLSFFYTAGSGGDTMNIGLEEKLNNFLKSHGAQFPLSQGYGMSEVSSAASCSCNGNFRSQSVGYPLLATTIAIFKPDTTEEIGYNEVGEICISGPTVMKGYLNNQAETDNVIRTHPDGTVWVHSGDLGYMDEDGYVYIKGRIKRMITRFDGHKVFPVQIEDLVGKHEAVESCAVVGVKDRTRAQGQMPQTFVKLNPGFDADKVREELLALYQTDLEERGRPLGVEFVDEMPHTGMGKIDYNKLAEDYDKALDSEGK